MTAALKQTYAMVTQTLLTMSKTQPADIFVCSHRFGEHVEKPYRVLYRSAQYFDVNASELEDLRRGMTPDELELAEVE